MSQLPFLKMHGLGNDFVIIDTRNHKISLDKSTIISLCNRRTGIGCDQLVLIESDTSNSTHCKIRFFNTDASESTACGNATRCIARLIFDNEVSSSQDHILLSTTERVLECIKDKNNMIGVYMGCPSLTWSDIPLHESYSKIDTKNINLNSITSLKDGMVVNMSNPHIVFFTQSDPFSILDSDCIKIQENTMFSEGVNVNIAQIKRNSILDIANKTQANKTQDISFNEIYDEQIYDEITLRVYERGSGNTLACGSGACATAVSSYLKKQTGSKILIHQSGGDLLINLILDSKDNIVNLLMQGECSYVFKGEML